MITPHQRKDRTQILIFAAVCVILIVAGFAWALFGDASSVIPIATPTAGATPATPLP